jgi:hypothetical protein
MCLAPGVICSAALANLRLGSTFAMSTDHRKPAVAFVVLAFMAAALVGVQNADAQGGRFLAAVVGSDVHARGAIAAAPAEAPQQSASWGSALSALSGLTSPVERSDGSPRSGADDQVSRTQVRPPAPTLTPDARTKTDDEAAQSPSALEEAVVLPSEELEAEGAMGYVHGRRGADRRGVDRRGERAAAHAAAHEEDGSRPGHRGRDRD